MVNAIGISDINPIKMFSALNAFKANDAISADNSVMQDAVSGTEINDMDLLKNQNIEEIQEFAKIAGEENISQEDISYGLKYGRSVIADYTA